MASVKSHIYWLLILIIWLLSPIRELKAESVCYVSSTSGNDSNSGSIEFPYKTINRALLSKTDTILLKSEDLFYERINLANKVIDKYGEGANPTICGVKIPKKGLWKNGVLIDQQWIECKSNIWRINLAEDDANYLGFQTNGSSYLNNAGAIINLATDDMNNCRKVPSYTDMCENFDFWQRCPISDTGSSKPEDFDYLYLYFDGNPNDYDFGISMGTTAVTIQNGELKNIDIKYWGFGIAVKDNVRISDCNIDGMGGQIQRGYKTWVIYGNGIECWVSPPGRKNCLIENCTISRTFDCGVTVQGSHKQKSLRAENIIFRNNTFRNCCQSFEEFLRGPGEEDLYYNCVFENNTSIDAGIDTGFRYWDKRYKRCHFLSNSNLRHTNMILRNNTAINGNYYCAGAYDNLYRQAKWQDNACHIKRGQDLLGNYGGTKDVLKIPTEKGIYSSLDEATDSIISRYRYLTGDMTTRFFIIE